MVDLDALKRTFEASGADLSSHSKLRGTILGNVAHGVCVSEQKMTYKICTFCLLQASDCGNGNSEDVQWKSWMVASTFIDDVLASEHSDTQVPHDI